jgi:hypothetical protein
LADAHPTAITEIPGDRLTSEGLSSKNHRMSFTGCIAIVVMMEVAV